jgi:hypothetical protein
MKKKNNNNNKKKKTVDLGRHLSSLYHCIAGDSMIPNMPVINPLQALLHPQTQETILHGLSILNPNFSGFAFFLGK